MAPVTSTSGRVLRSGRTGLQRSQRKISTHPTQRASRCNAKRLYKNCNGALDSVRKRKKQHQVTEEGSTGDSVDHKSSNPRKRPIRRATREAF